MKVLPLFLLGSALFAATDGVPQGWRTWSPRAEIAPKTYVDRVHYRTKPGALVVAGNSISGVHGGWEKPVSNIEPGAWYRFTAYYRAERAPFESFQLIPRVDWRDAKDRRAERPDYAYKTDSAGDWIRVTADIQAPANATSAVMQLLLYNAPQAEVWWDDVSLDKIPAPGARQVKVATINLRPQGSKSAAESVQKFVDTIEKQVTGKTDLILLPEGITVVGTGKQYADVAESIPGPTTATLGALAKKRGTYIAAGIYEREGPIVYNTAVLIDRKGDVVGKYRKVYIPNEEIEHGITAGNDYPVFQTDFGKVGIMICYDVFFADPAKNLNRRGAEMILLPIWGGNEVLAKARAIEEKIWLVTSGYDHPTYIMDPLGERVAQAAQGTAAVYTIDLNKRYAEKGLGDMHARRMREQRVDLGIK